MTVDSTPMVGVSSIVQLCFCAHDAVCAGLDDKDGF